jgi:hypothetical protein
MPGAASCVDHDCGMNAHGNGQSDKMILHRAFPTSTGSTSV